MITPNIYTEDIRHPGNAKNNMADQLKLKIPGLSRSFSLVEFIPKEASEGLWSAYFSLSETIFREFNPKRRLSNRDTIRRRFSTTNPLYTVRR